MGASILGNLPEQTLKGWLEDGVAYSEIKRRALDDFGVTLTTWNLSTRRDRWGIPPRQPRSALMPPRGVVLEKHLRGYIPIQLRAESRRRAGKSLLPTASRTLDGFLRSLENNREVVTYTRESGWVRVPRDAKDTDIVRF